MSLTTERSREFFERLCETMPGANTRTATYFPPYPLTIVRGEGAYIYDIDGNRLIDLVNNYTSLVHGHRAPKITEAILREAQTGTVFPAPIEAQAELAERICERVKSVERLRFTNSGTEAAMHAVRCARAVTGRDRIVKAPFGYHGSWEGAVPSMQGTQGIPSAVLDQIVWAEFNDGDQLEAAMVEHGEEVAAILLEPVMGAGVIPGDPEYFKLARRLADEYGALLVLDEVVTLRLEYGGYQDRLGVPADLSVFGKVIGGGLPIGAFGGRADLMEVYDPRRPDRIEHHGTFNGNSLAMSAGVASLDMLSESEILRINDLGARLSDGLREMLAKHGLNAVVTDDGSLVQVHFDVEEEPRCGSDLNPSSQALAIFHREALDEGVYIAPRGELNVTTAMNAEIVDEALDALDRAMSRVVV